MDYQLVKADTALCSEVDPELFFTQDSDLMNGKAIYLDVRGAKHLCAKCPLTMMCLTTAVKNEEDFGIWGGSTPRERVHLTTTVARERFVADLKKNFSTLESRRRRRPTQTI